MLTSTFCYANGGISSVNGGARSAIVERSAASERISNGSSSTRCVEPKCKKGWTVGMPERIKRTVTVKDVARLAGVSDQTVSRTVRDSPSVRPETKERVRAAMRELGYCPSFAARSLRRGRYQTIGIAMYDIASTGNLDRLDGFVIAAERNGYAVTLVRMTDEHPLTLAQASERMATLPVDGMVYTLNRDVSDFESYRPRPEFSTVIITMREHPHCSTVDNDQEDCSQQVVDYLLKRGHKTVHFISGPTHSLSGMARERGWRNALSEHGRTIPELFRGDWSPESGYEAGMKLAACDECTAIYASNDAMAYGCICALRERGKRVPEDVSVVGVDDILSKTVPYAGLTSVHFDNQLVAGWAIDKLVGAEGVTAEKERKLFKGKIVERTSVCEARG